MCDFVDVGNLEDGKAEGFHSHDSMGNSNIALKIPTLEGVMMAHEGDWIESSEFVMTL